MNLKPNTPFCSTKRHDAFLQKGGHMLTHHPDPTVAHVLETWAPRMIVQGIDYNDLMTTSRAFACGTIGAASGA